jgi:ABC-type lipoprotein release transport system permease subunit
MAMMLKLAFRNLFRHARRTLITTLAIAGGLALMLWSVNINNGVHDEMLRAGISTTAGHVVVQAIGWQDDREIDQLVSNASTVEAQLAEVAPQGVTLSRMYVSGLLSSPTNSVGVALSGIQPDKEVLVTDFHDKVVEGEYLSADDHRGILIGARLADSLDVGLGDKIVLMAQGGDEVESRLYRVRGLFRTGSEELDGFVAFAHIESTRGLLGVPDSAHQVSLHVDGVAEADPAIQAAKAGVTVPGAEVLAWQEAIPDMVEMIRIDDEANDAFMFIIGLIVAIGVLNTVLMSVMERVREFGVMLAVGMSRRRLFGLVILEGIVLGFGATAIGIALGCAVTWPFVIWGLDWSAFMGENVDVGGVVISTMIYASYNWPVTWTYGVAAVVMTIVASFYPAFKASRLRPVESLSHI